MSKVSATTILDLAVLASYRSKRRNGKVISKWTIILITCIVKKGQLPNVLYRADWILTHANWCGRQWKNILTPSMYIVPWNSESVCMWKKEICANLFEQGRNVTLKNNKLLCVMVCRFSSPTTSSICIYGLQDQYSVLLLLIKVITTALFCSPDTNILNGWDQIL